MIVGRFGATANYGSLPNQRGVPAGPPTRTPRIANAFWQDVWQNAAGLPAGLPPVTPASGDLRTPYDRVYEALGSTTNPSHFTMLQDAVNAAKGRIENFVSPMDPRRVRSYARAGAAGDEPSIEAFMAPLREVDTLSAALVKRMWLIIGKTYCRPSACSITCGTTRS